MLGHHVVSKLPPVGVVARTERALESLFVFYVVSLHVGSQFALPLVIPSAVFARVQYC